MSSIRFESTSIPGVVEIHAPVSADARGRFTKTFVAAEYEAAGLATGFVEEYHTESASGVVRGMHFQTPPHAHDKTVFCISGEVFDVVLDLRVGSPAYGAAVTFRLDGVSGRGLYIPAGCAHGFASLSDRSTLAYRVTSVYAPDCDAGVLWSSVPVDWPFASPVVSPRDAAFPALQQFESPFAYGAGR